MYCRLTLTDDQKQTIKSTISFLTESFKVFMATLLCIFVPQRCVENGDNLCTLADNFTNLTNFNIIVLVINFITLGNFMYLYIIEYKREQWCIDYLDIDNDKANTNLKTEINDYPEYKEEMISLNNKYHKLTILTLILNICNFILSSILIYGYYYLDYRSVTVLITNVLLIVDKLFACLNISNKSVEELLPISAYMTTSVIFNTIDSDHKKTIELTSIIIQETEIEKGKEQKQPEKSDQPKKQEQIVEIMHPEQLAIIMHPKQIAQIENQNYTINKLKNKLRLHTEKVNLQKKYKYPEKIVQIEKQNYIVNKVKNQFNLHSIADYSQNK
jgi:hypothetical protein